ncbi:MAG: alcohol dehydrogenase family protein [Acidimicrobiales bacterium]|nr:alcohol dehydrogenase family protein [Acidimicrobiales bacterium]
MVSIPDSMTAAQLVGTGGPEMLVVRHDVPVPEPAVDEVLIRVRACGMNNTDINTRIGWYSKSVTGATDGQGISGVVEDGAWDGEGVDFPRIQGADPCGEVVAVGELADPSLLGRRVLVDAWVRDKADPNDRAKAHYLGSERDGGYAQFCAVPSRNVYPIDSALTDVELASFPCSWSTAEHMLTRARLTNGETAVVTGASGGVGTALIQLAKLRGARVVAVTSTAKFDDVVECGADIVVDRSTRDLCKAVVDAAQGPVDVLADVVGGPGFAALLGLLRRGGRYTTAGAIAGPIVELDLRTLYLSDLELHGCTVYEPEVFATLVGYIQRGEVCPVVAGTFPLDDIHSAQEAFVAKNHTGNLVVTVS